MVEELESEVSQLYKILEFHKIFIQPTDLAMYQTLSPTLRSLRDVLDSAADSKDDNTVRFQADLEKLMTDLLSEVSEIRNAAQDPMVLNPSSNSDEVIKYLDELQGQLDKVNSLKLKYEEWGKLFKNGGRSESSEEEGGSDSKQGNGDESAAETTEMEETIKEVELKSSLWNGLKEWEKLVE